MSWRNQMNHREETRAVKRALRNMGIEAKVGHGTGTAWAWLDITPISWPAYMEDWQVRKIAVIRIAQGVTGRHGDYDGYINIL